MVVGWLGWILDNQLKLGGIVKCEFIMRRYWWHCTAEYHGATWIAERRCPKNCSRWEPKTPRLCVAPTIAECFAAVLFPVDRSVYCYRSEKKYNGVTPKGVWDAVITREAWLIPPVRMLLVRTVAAPDVVRSQEFVRMYHTLTRKTSSLRVRVSQLMCAAVALESSVIQARACRLLQLCGIEDAEQYLFNLCDLDEQ